jgi:hypothetical protein
MRQRHWYITMLALVLTLSHALAKAQDVRVDTLQALQSTTPIPGSQVTPGDFNGDGVSDLLWYNPLTSQVAYWLLGNGQTDAIIRTGARTFSITRGYYVGAVGNFHGNGLADIVFTSAKHDLYLWTNDGQGGFRSNLIGTYPAGWQLVGAGDVDGDGHDDLLWFDASGCQFGYWLMNGSTRVGLKTVPATCGYYPVSIGYYTPSNRISIVWTSAQNDMIVWDSLPTGFASSSLGSFYSGYHAIVIGGGFAGQMLTVIAGAEDSLPVGMGVGGAQQQMLNRTFDANGLQIAVVDAGGFSGGFYFPWRSANFFITGHGATQTGVIYQYGNELLEVCSAAGRADVNYAPAANSHAFAQPINCTQLSFPRGWFVVGAMANGVIPKVTP